jgi:putative transposase
MEVPMPMGRPKPPLSLTPEERQPLEAVAASRVLPHGLVRRAQIVLLSAAGVDNKAIAARLHLSPGAVGYWRRRFLEQGLSGLHGELRSGRPRSISDERVAALVRKTLQATPAKATHWSCRSAAARTGLSKSTVHRIWCAFGLQPHRQRHFQLSNDPFFVEKVRDIVGLYLHPPDNAVVLCVDEKSQIQALERNRPLLPMGLGYVEGVTHNYLRHGTTTLFAALNLSTGRVIGQCHRRHRHQEYLDFLREIDANVPGGLTIHLIVDNYATHKHPRVRRWLAAHPRYQVHFTPTYASWLNQIEIWFNIITQKAIRRGTFGSVKELVAQIDRFVRTYNSNASPFVWTATADPILQKIGSIAELVGKEGCGRSRFVEKSRYGTFPLRLEIRQRPPDFHFSHSPGGGFSLLSSVPKQE